MPPRFRGFSPADEMFSRSPRKNALISGVFTIADQDILSSLQEINLFMSYVNIMVHGVWGTKSRHSLLPTDVRKKVCNHIKENASSKGIFIDTINGYDDHLHSLMNLKPELNISTQMQLIKGESAYWINQNHLVQSHFGWSDKYFAESVSPHDLDRIRYYINNQEAHHHKLTFEEEMEEFLKKNGFNKG